MSTNLLTGAGGQLARPRRFAQQKGGNLQETFGVQTNISARPSLGAVEFVQVQELLMVAAKATLRGSVRSVCGLYRRCINRILG